ncbi:hypothetical protein PSENEW3_00003010 [Picochlorum sp. SENEW3]|nr:hypothetical protein PSENEW3_00003010 [Picochlorum sp. SENEW3]
MLGQRPRGVVHDCRWVTRTTTRSPRCHGVHQYSKTDNGDVIVVGAGVVGLFIASRLLQRGYTVVLLESAQGLCSGATGAGQGYIWQSHRDPLAVGAWKMAEQSKQEWKELLSPHVQEEEDLYDENGSLLLATTKQESVALKERVESLHKHGGLHAKYLSSYDDIVCVEPSLRDSRIELYAGVVTPSDAQIDGRRAVDVLFTSCVAHGGERFVSRFGHAVESLILRDDGREGQCAHGVVLDNGHTIYADRIVVAAGAWSGQMLSTWLGEQGDAWKERIVPRRGHLLVCTIPRTDTTRQLRHGIMEAKYTHHYSKKGAADEYDVTFTATENALDGSLLIGSSRELLSSTMKDSWVQDAQPHVVRDILDRAREFLPQLLDENMNMTIRDVRVGLRPFATHHHAGPYIGPVRGIGGLFVSSGHEGSGLTLAPASADVLMHHLFHDVSIDADIEAYTQTVYT